MEEGFVHPFANGAPPGGFTAVEVMEAGAGRRVVAHGPAHGDRVGAKALPCVLAVDGDGAWWFAPNAHLAPSLWVAVSKDTLAAVRQRYARDEPGRGATAYLSLGLVQDLEGAVDRLLDHDPFCSSYPVPPGPEGGRGTPTERHGVETLHSRSRLTLEAYGALVTVRVDHAPVGDGLRADLPVDVWAVLSPWPVQGPAALREALAGEPDPRLHVPALIAAELIGADLAPQDLAHLVVAGDTGLRRAAIEVAGRRGWKVVLASAQERERDPAIQRMIAHYLAGAS